MHTKLIGFRKAIPLEAYGQEQIFVSLRRYEVLGVIERILIGQP